MKNCLRIPRLLLPREGFERFACPAPDCRSFDVAFWERAEHAAGEEASALRMTLPEIYMGDEEEARIHAIWESAYRALEEDKLEKLVRGGIRTERTLPSGEVRKGVVLCLDLEEFSLARGKGAGACAAQQASPARVALYRNVLDGSPLSFSHAVMLYRDKKDRIGQGLENENLEQMYEFGLPSGGKIAGYFLDNDLAEDVAVLMHARLGTSFVSAEGDALLAAAKGRWEDKKKGLTPSERICHPARYVLAEFVNLYDESVRLYPVHRLLSETDAEAAADHLSRNVRCRREGRVLIPAVPPGGEGARRVDALLSAYLRANGGRLQYVEDEERLHTLSEDSESLGILLKAPEKEELFDDVRDAPYPEHTFTLGDKAKRYCLEGRETSYD